MIFLSAQPSDEYFKWQLKVQIKNLQDLNFTGEYHILIRYQGNKPQSFVDLQNELEGTQYKIFFYEEKRPDWPVYLPSLRPYIIKQHLAIYPLDEFFYFDSDVIFRQLPDFQLLSDSKSYCSDTIGYIGADYIKSKSEQLFLDLCSLVNIEPSLVESNQHNSGGAQYYLKGTTSELWEKIEKDSIAIHLLMKQWNTENVKPNQPHSDVQAWCADMWSVLWNCWRSGIKLEVNPELNFCWATDPIHHWDKTKIMHNAGVGSDQNELFYKGKYININPIKELIPISNWVSKDFCSFKYAQAIDLLRDVI